MVVATTRLTQLDDLLARISQRLQLSPTDYVRVEQSYRAVTGWLRAKESPVARFLPDIYAQGSFKIRTTVKPRASKSAPMDDAASPLPRLETTPPVTKINLGITLLRLFGVFIVSFG